MALLLLLLVMLWFAVSTFVVVVDVLCFDVGVVCVVVALLFLV